MRVGITGQNGFIGKHLSNNLRLRDDIKLVAFNRGYFESIPMLETFVQSCDCIVHLAGLNRHADAKVIYDTNVLLVEKIIRACENTDARPHIIFASSTQENSDNPYGQSKLKCRNLLEQWSEKNDSFTTGLIIPNVFGPFGDPYYNSVVATFCHKLANGESPELINDKVIELIYIDDLVMNIIDTIYSRDNSCKVIPPQFELKVSELLVKLNSIKDLYFKGCEIPSLRDRFDMLLFNTFRTFIPDNHYPQRLVKHTDDRGSFVELARTNSEGQFSFSTSKANVTRGNHFHTRKAERFVVIQGSASIKLRRVDDDEVIEYILTGESPSFVDIPIWHVHNITNIGDGEMIVLFWINEAYDPSNSDTYFMDV